MKRVKKTEKTNLLIHKEHRKSLEKLPPDEFKEVITAMFAYTWDGELKSFQSDRAEMCFDFIRCAIDNDLKRYYTEQANRSLKGLISRYKDTKTNGIIQGKEEEVKEAKDALEFIEENGIDEYYEHFQENSCAINNDKDSPYAMNSKVTSGHLPVNGYVNIYENASADERVHNDESSVVTETVNRDGLGDSVKEPQGRGRDVSLSSAASPSLASVPSWNEYLIYARFLEASYFAEKSTSYINLQTLYEDRSKRAWKLNGKPINDWKEDLQNSISFLIE